MERVEKEYIPLSGQELLEVIFRKGKKVAAEYRNLFGPHVAYHNPRIELAIRVRCFTPEGTPEMGGFEEVIPLGGTIVEPDQIREELGIGTFETQLVDENMGTLADVKVGAQDDAPADNVDADHRKQVVEKVNKLIKGAKRKSKPKAKRS